MRFNYLKETLKTAVLVATVLLLGAGTSAAQQTINLTAGPTTLTLPDGSTVPMWGYTCGAAVTGSTATCAKLNPLAPAATTTTPAGWSPVVIKVPTGQSLTINLTNNLSFTPTGATTANRVPTSITIVGQVGGGLGVLAQRTTTPSPSHAGEQSTVTWSTVGPAAVPGTPPLQAPRVQSFGTEVPATTPATTTALTWTLPRPGTYLIESGTHPSIQGPMGLYGILVVTSPATAAAAGTAYPAVAATTTSPAVAAVTYNAEVPLELSEIDPVQNNAVNAAVRTAGFSETMVWSGQPTGCGNPSSTTYHQCYPPAVNYKPLYYLFNGVAFSKANPAASFFQPLPAPFAPQTGTTGTVLVRLVNAGLHMHVPSIVGSSTGTTSAGGFSLIAEDGNPLPGLARVQSEIFLAPGKTYDLMINEPAAAAKAIAVYDRELSLSGNGTERDAGMLAYINIQGAVLPAASGVSAVNDAYAGLVAGQTYSVADPGKGVIANDTNVYGVQLLAPAAHGTVTLNPNGTFTYVPTGTGVSDTFTYCANGSVTGTTCSSGISATVTLSAAALEATTGIAMSNIAYTSKVASYIKIAPPGVLSVDKDGAGYPLTVNLASIAPASGLVVNMDSNGGFNAIPSAVCTTAAGCPYTFTYKAQNAQGILSAGTATVTITYPAASNLAVTVKDPKTGAVLTDYRWIIEEDKSFYQDPAKTTNAGPTSALVPILGVNFHTSDMTYVAQGCTGSVSCESGQTMIDTGVACTTPPSTANPAGTPAGCSVTAGQHIAVACDLGNGNCHAAATITYPDGSTGTGTAPVLPSQVGLDPGRRYYISVLPGDAANAFIAGNAAACVSTPNATPANCGHSMSGSPIPAVCTPATPGAVCTGTFAPVTVLVQQEPYPTAKLSVNVFEDDFPLNGEQDSSGGIDALSPNEPGLGGFNIIMWDDMGGSGDVTGQMTYDMFNMPLGNSLDGTLDPASGQNACPITKGGSGITGMIVTCPKYEADGITLSPLAGQAVIANLMPGRFSVQAVEGADRIAAGEQWLQTNTLDGQHAHDSFLRIGEPNYFQEFGPAGYHVNIGFANPKIINARLGPICNGTDPNLSVTGGCGHTVTGKVTTSRMSRVPDERLYSSGSRDSFYFTQCYVSVGDPDGEDFAFTTCNQDGTFSLSGLPAGQWRLTTFDQWNDQLVDGLSFPIDLTGAPGILCPGAGSTNATCNMGDIPANQWQSNVYTRTFVDDNRDGVYQAATATTAGEIGIPFLNTAVRYRDGSVANNLVTDFGGVANFNETFPLFNWYVVETDTTRYKTTGIHTVYDSGGPADGSASCGITGYPPCGTSTIGKFLANTAETASLPTSLRVPGAVYCTNADCTGQTIAGGPGSSAAPSTCTASSTGVITCSNTLSTGRIDPGWVPSEGWQGYSGQNNFIEFGKVPYAVGETGGIHGHVVYASTRPFDDPYMLVQTQWEPLVPNVTMNLYQEGFAADGVTPTLTLVDTTQTSSFDAWAQGFRTDGAPNMNCPGQWTSDLFYFTLYNQPNYLDAYSNTHNGTALHPIPYNSQFKCYDGMHNWNQLEPAPYDGMYNFPSVTGRNPATGNTTGTNCTICVKNPDAIDAFRFGKEDMLPPGKYVVEVVPPPGYEIVKEEDKNILIGDNYIAPVSQQFGGLGNIFIMPDQAQVGSAYNANNAQNPTQSLGASPNNGIVPGFAPEPTWPCVGQTRVVPDYISLFPQSHQVAPFAGATRNLCDRKEVTLDTQAGAIAKFYLYTSTHKASKFTGIITDDFTSEFDPFSPQFGEKFAPANLPISVKDWAGNEINRVYSDWWGTYDGLTYSTWEVNPPNPTGYSPTMMVMCMNDKGPTLDTRATILNSAGASVANPTLGQMVTDPLFNSDYSQFCYELPFMPGQTAYLDTPVVPTSAFSAGYNHPDCNYPALTPAIAEVDGDGYGPWIAATGTSHPITIHALGDQIVPNYAYSGPQATTAPYNQKQITRHYGFGGTKGTVTIGSQSIPAANITTWSDTTIVLNVPTTVTVPNCAIQQQAQYGGSIAQCGQLVITASTGQQSVDTVTVTIGGKAPTHVTSKTPLTPTNSGAIQQAIDAASPGDMIIIDPTVTTTGTGATAVTTTSPSTHAEMLLMWKPVRLQGVGAATSIIDANSQPAGKLDPWRRQVDCLFGIAMNGSPITTNPPNPYDAATDTANNGGPYICPGNQNFAIDRLPLEGVVGWNASLNGNLAELLQEPSLMGAYEGAAITVLGKGAIFPSGVDPFQTNNGTPGVFPTGTVLLTAADCATGTGGSNPYPGNFQCNPSSIDGLGITDSSQGGGGIFAHGWNHNLQIANNRIYSNIGTLTGGINIGQGEFPPSYTQGSTTNAAPGSCMALTGAGTPGSGVSINNPSLVTNQQLPYCHNLNVNVHNNSVTQNMSIGDELFAATPAGTGGVAFCTGADYYKFNYNWVCGNMSTGDGGGVGHLGLNWNGDIEHNTIIFNQSVNPTIQTNGGGLLVMGTPDIDPTCGTSTDADCVNTLPPNPAGLPPNAFGNGGGNGTSDGIGPGLVINANLILGNAAESGSGGGIRIQEANGTDVLTFPNNNRQWYSVNVTNNIIVNNVAGWDGAGVSLGDSLAVNLLHNTIASNDSTATSGALFNTLGAPLASAPNPTNQTTSSTTSAPQVAGVVAVPNSPQLIAGLAGLPAGTTLTCPANHPNCAKLSNPYLADDLIWKNRTFYVGVGNLSSKYQQNIISMFNSFSGTQLTTSQGTTGACLPGSSYWDIGVRGDSAPANHGSGYTLAPTNSVLTDASDYPGATPHNLGSDPAFVSQYCNGSRTPPELSANNNSGQGNTGLWNVPPGISDATVPNPIFNLTPSATVDEGNNWVNMTWGPITLTNPTTGTTVAGVTTYGSGAVLGNYALTAASPAADYIPFGTFNLLATTYPILRTDFFGNRRPEAGNTAVDVGAIELQTATAAAVVSVSPTSLAFGSVPVNTTSAAQTLTLSNTGTAAFTGITLTFTGPYSAIAGTNACAATLPANATCFIYVTFHPTAAASAPGSLAITGSVAVTGSPVSFTGTGTAATATATLTPASHNFGTVVRNCPGPVTGQPACLLDPAFAFTLTNTGNVPLTGVTAGTLGGANPTEFFIFPALSNCGNATHTTLAPGATCLVTVQFRPLTGTANPTGVKNATISFTDLAGTQISTLTGTAN